MGLEPCPAHTGLGFDSQHCKQEYGTLSLLRREIQEVSGESLFLPVSVLIDSMTFAGLSFLICNVKDLNCIRTWLLFQNSKHSVFEEIITDYERCKKGATSEVVFMMMTTFGREVVSSVVV